MKNNSAQKAPSCDWRSGAPNKPSITPKPKIMRAKGKGQWEGVRTERYKQSDGEWADVIRKTLIGGQRGERTKFHLRYFEIAPGGRTSLEHHEHEHVVIGVLGRGICRIRRTGYNIGPMDVVYIPPGAAHQLSNPASEPFGFFCIVDAERDRPALIEQS